MKDYRISNDKLMELDQQIGQWKDKYKNILLIKLDQDPFDGIFRVPDAEDTKAAGRLKDDLDKNKQLALSCLLYPSVEDFNAVLAEKPGIVVPLATKLIEEYGATQEATVKKL